MVQRMGVRKKREVCNVEREGQEESAVACMMPDNDRACNECGERVTVEKG